MSGIVTVTMSRHIRTNRRLYIRRLVSIGDGWRRYDIAMGRFGLLLSVSTE